MNPFDKLRDEAIKGNVEAAHQLFMIAFNATDCLMQAAEKNPKPFLALTRVSAVFPAMICPNKSMDDKHKKLLKVCEVGKDSTLNSSNAAGMNFSTQAKVTAGVFYQRMKQIRAGEKTHPEPSITERCLKLPKPNRGNFTQWNAVMQAMLPGVEGLDLYPPDLWPDILKRPKEQAYKLENYQKVDAIKKAISGAFHTLLPE
jgi:hypothetical protein